jgi:chromosome segregation ATPase
MSAEAITSNELRSSSMEGPLWDLLKIIFAAIASASLAGVLGLASRLRAVENKLGQVEKGAEGLTRDLSTMEGVMRSNSATMAELSHAVTQSIERHKIHDAFQEQQLRVNETLFNRLQSMGDNTSAILQATARQEERIHHMGQKMDGMVEKMEDLSDKLDLVRIKAIGEEKR